jgi:hypothetical protein
MKPKLTEQIFEQEIINSISSESSEVHKKTNFYELLQTKYTCTKSYTLKWWDIYYSKHVNSANKSLSDIAISQKVEALKSGLKSKYDRLIELQKQVESLEVELKNNIMIVHTFSDGQLIQGIRPINALEKASINKTIKEIRAEISKLEGDYPATKTENLHEFKQPPPEIDL